MPTPVIVTPLVVPPVTPPASVPVGAPPTIVPVLTPVTVMQAATPTGPMPIIVLPAAPAGLQTLLPPTEFVEPQPEWPAVPVEPGVPEVPVTKQPREPAIDVPLHRVRKQDRN